jgi:hypothetical protein
MTIKARLRKLEEGRLAQRPGPPELTAAERAARLAALLLRTAGRGNRMSPGKIARLQGLAAGQADPAQVEGFLEACWRHRGQEGRAP